MKISASILATQISTLENTLKSLDQNHIDYIHMDVMDGNFVPQISFGEALCKETALITKIPLDVHLMVKNPEFHVPKYFALDPEFITFHLEATHFSVRLSTEIRKNGIKAGIAINPQTPVELLEPVIPFVDMILIMTVEPGFYGQSFITNGFEKIQKAKKLIGKNPVILQVDGGINVANIEKIAKLGTDMIVAGSAVFQGNPNENAANLKRLTVKD